MQSAQQTLEQQFFEMRWRALSLAADLDRIQRAPGGSLVLQNDPRINQLREALDLLLKNDPGRAEKLQLIFSDKTPPPSR